MEDEFSGLDCSSRRLERRFIRTMETLSKHPDKSIWFCSENRAEAKAIYRLLGNGNLERGEVLRAHRQSTIKRIKQHGGTILAVQDTTSLNYNTHGKTEGIGYISDKSLGVNIHSCLAVTTDGLVLGLLDQTSYSRAQARDGSQSNWQKRLRPLEEKESGRWASALESSTEGLPGAAKLITVCDREGDIYELFDTAESGGHLLLVRAAWNRLANGNQKTLDCMRRKRCDGKAEVAVPRDSRRNLKERKAVLQIRHRHFEIRCPPPLKDRGLKDSLKVWVIYAKEENPPEGAEPVEWFLMTNEPVETAEAAYERVRYYAQRWKIERFHYVLKSGCGVEKLQERSMDKTTLLVLMYSVIAVVIMNMAYIARIHPEEPCTALLEEDEWKLLYRAANKTKNAPEKPYTMQEALTYISWLGGPKKAPSDGPPGLKTVWEGMKTLNTLMEFRECMT
jgi:hypothetical protein